MCDNRTLEERLLNMSMPVPESGCWLWTHQISPSFGYAWLKYKNKRLHGHRASWTAFRGPIPEGMSVLHKCDTPSCINPYHLYLGTQADNMRDRKERNRYKPPLGDTNHSTKVSDTAVHLVLSSTLPSAELAEMFGCTVAGIYQIRTKKRAQAKGKRARKPIKRQKVGENATFVKLKEDAVLEILNSTDSQQKLADRFGVSRSCIQSIKNRRTWAYLGTME